MKLKDQGVKGGEGRMWIRSKVLVPLLASAVALAGLGGSTFAEPAAGDEPCKLAKGDSPMAKACAEGGIRKAKEVMKGLVRNGRKAGVKMECDECHKDPERYEVLAKDARDKLKNLMQAAAPAAPAAPAPPAK